MSQLSRVNPLSHHELLQWCNIRSQLMWNPYFMLDESGGGP